MRKVLLPRTKVTMLRKAVFLVFYFDTYKWVGDQKVNVYDQEILQSHITGGPMAPRGRDTEH